MSKRAKKKNDQSRRAFLRGALTTGALTTGLASPALAGEIHDEQGSTGTASIGITDDVRELFGQGKKRQAVALLEKHDIGHSQSDLTLTDRTFAESAEGISSETVQPQITGGVFDEETSDIDFLMYHNAGNLYSVEIVFDHEPALSTDCLAPSDVLAVTYSSARWQYEPGSENLLDGWLVNFESEQEGCRVEWHYDAYPARGETRGHMAVLLRKADAYADDPSNVWAHYKHVYTPSYKFSCFNGLLGSNVSLSAGNVSVSLDTNSWEQNTVESM